jgi:hypothetical protein
VRFDWQRPLGSLCPTRAVLQADVEAGMGRHVFADGGGVRAIVHGAIADDLDGVHVHIEAASVNGETLGTRDLHAPAGQCASLRDAIVLVLTLFVEYADDVEAEPANVLGFGAAGELASTPLPRFAFAVGPALLFEHDRSLQLRVSAAYWPEVEIATARGVGATLQAVSMALRACLRVIAGFGLCAGVESGALIATPLRLRGPARQVRLLGHGVLDARWELELGRIMRADLAAGPLLSFSRPAFSYLRADGERMAVYRPRLTGIIFQLTLIILSP